MKNVYLTFIMIVFMGSVVGAENKALLSKKPLSEVEIKQLLLVRNAYTISLMALNQAHDRAVDMGVKAGIGSGVFGLSCLGLHFLHKRVDQSHNATAVINYLKKGALWGKSIGKYSALCLAGGAIGQFLRAADAFSQYSFMIGILDAMGNYDGTNKSSSIPEKK
jgi:hypothetical protein